uniref:Glycoside hydrolase 15-related protein n=1 Tax=Geobacter sp. (strain M21) TaxID=443144 RepID=C6E1C7_GEOSM
MYKKIGDYGVIGNLQTVALVGKDGAIDWLCLPQIDSPSVFGALLDADDGGTFSVTPEGEWDSVLYYLQDSNVLSGRYRTRTGTYTLTDFLTVPSPSEGNPHDFLLIRLLHVERGTVRVRVTFDPRFDYGRVSTACFLEGPDRVVARGGPESLTLCCSRTLELKGDHAEGVWGLEEGDRVALRLYYGEGDDAPLSDLEAERLVVQTLDFWRGWLYRSGTGFFNDLGPHREQVVRSLLALKLLYYSPHGTMAAAATTSLPEEIRGVRNWDYRFSWVRDTSMALSALFQVGHVREAENYLDRLRQVIVESEYKELQVMYRLDGSSELEESELPHLEGFRGSRPVRIGNRAAHQKQFSIYGHVLIAAHLLALRDRSIDSQMWEGLRYMCDFARNHWDEADWSIWEMRSDARHYVHSKVMCWVTLDRGLKIADLTGFHCEREQWEKARDEIRREIMSRGWSDKRQGFVLHYDTDALDGSALLMSMSGFLPFEDPSMLSTVEALRLDLSEDGFVYRYLTDDGLPGREGTFLPCTLWLITNLARQGELDEAELLLTKVDQVGAPLHLLAEEYDPSWREQLGNFPQAFSHEAYITAATTLIDFKGREARRPKQEEYVLPRAAGKRDVSLRAEKLARVLEEAWRSGDCGANACISDPDGLSRRLSELLGRLHAFRLDGLEKREERISFWCNLYNLLILYGLLALDVSVSVREVPRFYRRVGCRIGEEVYSADVILNGVLRGNRPAPGRLTPPLPAGDPRLAHSVRPSDSRALFATCTGTVSSPPAVVLRPESLDADLDRAARTFLADRGSFDPERKVMVLPRLFKWYDDFGNSPHDIAVNVAGFLDDALARPIREHPEAWRLEYAEYDWRLPGADEK